MSAIIIPLPGVRLPHQARKEKVARSARRAYRLNLSGAAHERTMASSDPIFKAIAVHLDAVIAEMELSDYTGQSIEAERAEKANTERLSALSSEALKAVLSTAPTTLEGVIALLEHVARHEFLDPDSKVGDDECSGHETFLTSYNECFGAWKRFGQEFPLRLAAAIRGLLQTAPGAA
jgi:hypothetical protein